MIQSPAPLQHWKPSHPKRCHPNALPPSPLVLPVASVFGEAEDAAKHSSSSPARAEIRPKVGGGSPPVGPCGWVLGHGMKLWEKIRCKHWPWLAQARSTHKRKIAMFFSGVRENEQFHCSSIAWASNWIQRVRQKWEYIFYANWLGIWILLKDRSQDIFWRFESLPAFSVLTLL